MQNDASAVFMLVLVTLVLAHQAPSFPGQNIEKPPEVIFFCDVARRS